MARRMEIPATALNAALQDSKMEVMDLLDDIATQYPRAISFAPGRTQEAQFEVSKSLQYIDAYAGHPSTRGLVVAGDNCAGLGQYGRTNGIIGELIATMLRNDEAIDVECEDIVVTAGGQEAISLCLLTLCGNPHDVVLLPDPAYAGFTAAARVLGIEVAPLACDEQGLDLDVLEDTVLRLRSKGKQARLLYLSPDLSHPMDMEASQAYREALHAVTCRLGIVIVEDQAYSYFQYDGKHIPAMKSAKHSDHVVYLGSFSKSIYPGLRVGYIATTLQISTERGNSIPLAHELSKVKNALTISTSPLCQAVVGGLLLKNEGSLKSYVAPRLGALQHNRDAMLAALEANFPSSAVWCRGVSWSKPRGGFFLRLQVPFLVSSDDLEWSAKEFGVLWTPMCYFHVKKATSDEMRLAFSYLNVEQIERGIAALAKMIKRRVQDLSRCEALENVAAHVAVMPSRTSEAVRC